MPRNSGPGSASSRVEISYGDPQGLGEQRGKILSALRPEQVQSFELFSINIFFVFVLVENLFAESFLHGLRRQREKGHVGGLANESELDMIGGEVRVSVHLTFSNRRIYREVLGNNPIVMNVVGERQRKEVRCLVANAQSQRCPWRVSMRPFLLWCPNFARSPCEAKFDGRVAICGSFPLSVLLLRLSVEIRIQM